MTSSVSPGKLLPEQRQAIERLVSSGTFASAPRLRSVLLHLAKALEEGTEESVSEQSIGQAVFGRPAGYNASEDNIVRVTVRHLRNRLEDYYANEGANEAVVLVIPKGKYIPSFVGRPAEKKSSEPEQTTSPQMPMDEAPPPIVDTSFSPWTWKVIAACVAVVLIAFGCGWLARSLRPARDTASTGVLGEIFRKQDNVSIVTVDANLQAYRSIFGKQVTLDSYIHRNYATELLQTNDPRVRNAQRFANGSNETNVSSAIVAAAMKQALTDRRLVIKHPHDVSMRDFQGGGNVILLGGPWSNPWGQIFEDRFNFRLVPQEGDPSTPEIHNLHPIAGEADVYRPHMDGNLNVNYVRIAILPNMDHTGHVILLGATSAESLEASGTYLLSQNSEQEILSRSHAKNMSALESAEFLIEVRGLDAVPDRYRMLSVRTSR